MTLPGSYGEATPHHCSTQAKRGTHARRTATTSSSTGLPRRTTQGKACSWRTPSGWTPGSSTCGTPNPSTSTSALITLRRTACTDGNPDGGNSCSIFLSLGCAKQAGPRGSVTHLALRDSAGSGEAGSAALRALKGPQLHLPHLYLLASPAYLCKRPQHLRLACPPPRVAWSLASAVPSQTSWSPWVPGRWSGLQPSRGHSGSHSLWNSPSWPIRHHLPEPTSSTSCQLRSALLWKQRAEAALDLRDKAQHQLQVCEQREPQTELQQEQWWRNGHRQTPAGLWRRMCKTSLCTEQ